jgi:hypothetical protein
MVRAYRRGPGPGRFALVALASILISGCAIVPRAQLDDCQRLSRTLRSENARLKDQVLALQSQNRDYADRAVDDLRRLAARDQAIEQLEHSVQAYQEERNQLGEAFEQLTTNLGRSTDPSSTPGASTRNQRGRGAAVPATKPEGSRSKGVATMEDQETPVEAAPDRAGRPGP